MPSPPDVSAKLIVGGRDPHDPKRVWVGLDVTLGDGWKTYWRSAGDGGLPPELDWQGSTNLAGQQVFWPLPERLSFLGIDSLGYKHRVLLPIAVELATPEQSANLTLNAALYVCSTLCVREEKQLQATIPPGNGNLVGQALIDNALATVPAAGPSHSLKLLSAGIADRSQLIVQAEAERGFDHPDLLVEAGDQAIMGKPEVILDDGGKSARFVIPWTKQAGTGDAGKSVRLTLIDGSRAIEQTETLGIAAPVSSGQGLPILLVAFLGGLILNLMPCVLPVLSLKLMSVARARTLEQRALRLGFAATALGIVASFLLLALAMAGLKASGASVGWGIQFQQPLFLTLMALLLTLFAANMLGLFEIHLPGWAAPSGGGARHHLVGDFGTGLIATLLATPCSAPFVGTAVGFAFSRGPLQIGGIFLAMGLGMATPYLLAATLPGLARFLPRPGRWMLHLRRILGVLLLVTAAWLVSLITSIVGEIVGLVALASLLVILALLFVRDRMTGSTRRALGVTAFGIGIILLAAQPVLGWVLTPPPSAATATAWRSFDTRNIDDLVRAGRTVLVDVTADWCITCKVNERLVLEQAAIVRRFDDEVVPMRGDWTRPDPRIADFLKSHGRYGIPFNVVYGPRAPTGIVLPELLTVQTVLDAIEAASVPAPSIGLASAASPPSGHNTRLR